MCNLHQCHICKDAVETNIPASSKRHYSIDQLDQFSRICDDCNELLKYKIVLICEEKGIRTGEVLFVERGFIDQYFQNFTESHDLYVLSSKDMRRVAEKIIELQ